MDTTDHLIALDRDGAAFLASCQAAGLGTPVASCPGWNVSDLLWHLTEVHHFWRTVVDDRLDTWEGYEQPARPDDTALPQMFSHGLSELSSVLRSADPAGANWTWSSDRTAGFVIHRMAQETAVHRWDADDASGHPVPIEASLASDGIDEFLEHFLDGPSEGAQQWAGSVHLHCTDVAGEWTVREGDDSFVVTREHAKGACALRGAASDLLLALWRRQPLSTVDVVGDADVAARFVALSPLE